MKLKTLAIGFATGLVAAVCLPAAAFAAEDADPLFYSGVIRQEGSGFRAAAVSKTLVSVEYWPDAKIGQAIEPQVLATATTDNSGKYGIRLDPDDVAVEKAMAANGDWLNVVLRYGDGDSADFANISQYWNGKSWGDPNRPDTAPDKQHAAAVDAEQGTLKASAVAARPTCYWYVTSKPAVYTKVVEYHSSSATTGSWEYGNAADSDVEVGYKASGEAWEVSGTSHVATNNSASVGIEEGRGKKGYYGTTKMQYQVLRLDTKPAGSSTNTTCGFPWSGKKVGTKMVTAKSWLGGVAKTGNVAQYDCNDSPQKKHSVDQVKGSFLRTSKARASKLGGAATVGGAKLGSTSGYSSNVKLQWKWSKKGRSCGGNDAPVRANTIYVN